MRHLNGPLHFFLLMTLLTAPACGRLQNALNEDEDQQARDAAPTTQLEAIQKHPAFQRLVMETQCDPVTRTVSSYIFETHLTRRVSSGYGEWVTYSDRVRLLFDPRTQLMKSVSDGQSGDMRYTQVVETKKYTLSGNIIEVQDFGTIALAADGNSLILNRIGSENGVVLTRSSVHLTTQADKLDYEVFCKI